MIEAGKKDGIARQYSRKRLIRNRNPKRISKNTVNSED